MWTGEKAEKMEDGTGGRRVRGEVTAFLSLVFLLLLSFVGGVIESASIQVSKNYKKADMDLAMESVFAEYQRDLLEHYEVFALESTYETGDFSKEHIKRRLEYYGALQMQQEVTRIQLLTDDGGRAFYEQVITYIAEKTGTDKLQGMLGGTTVWEEQKKQGEEFEALEQASGDELTHRLEEIQSDEAQSVKLPEDETLQKLTNLPQSALLEQIMPKSMTLSNKQAHLSEFVSGRTLQKGWGNFADPKQEEALGNLSFGEYVLEHFGNAVAPQDDGVLSYELEYLLAGMKSDKENLEEVAKKLRLIRFGVNYAYLMSSSAKQAEAEAMALTMATVIALPEFSQIVKQALLLGWAYGESIVDLRSLLNGSQVPLVKTEESWQLSLSGLLTLGTGEGETDGADAENGLTYKEYLRMLLFLEGQEELTMRTLDLVEQDINIKYKKAFFKADYCVSKLEVLSTCSLRRGIQFDFKTSNQYK